MQRTYQLLLIMAALLGLLAASCGSSTTAAGSSTTAGGASTTAGATATAVKAVTGDLVVFAASSLTESFNEIGSAFMTEHPGTKVTFNYGASSELVTQINQGAPVDVYASADQANMTKLTDAGNGSGQPKVFATNLLQIIVGKGNPKGIQTVADLAQPGLIYVTAAPEVPIGKYAAQVLTTAGVTATPASFEQNVKGIVTKVTAGEADAGIVYATDVQAAGAKAQGVDIPATINVKATYPMVVTKAAPNPDAAAAFIDFALSEQGQKILHAKGFLAP